MSEELGTLRRVDPRTLWSNEARAFTPWLAREENVALLSSALGMQLEVENTEVACGPYCADILARETVGGSYVVIENQLGKTDHDHLGKAITYASVLGAQTVVWVATDFSDEHKKALDWLNDNSIDEVSFFGIRAELWRIDDSRPAIRFNVISRPTEVVREANRQKATGTVSASRQLQLEWWTALRDTLAETKTIPSLQSPRPKGWYDVAIGRSGFVISNIASTYEPKIAVRLYLSARQGGVLALQKLATERDTIEREIGMPLKWNANPEAMDKTVAAVRTADISKREDWSDHLRWMADLTVRFRNAFGPRLRAMDLGDPLSTEANSVHGMAAAQVEEPPAQGS